MEELNLTIDLVDTLLMLPCSSVSLQNLKE